ncbi:hypothetical protein, partial [Klebsiella variicola]|uniref:hypothetical protein n=1 Tax=Klebsiella variicola TaxID=244366 RepID=UPI002730528C
SRKAQVLFKGLVAFFSRVFQVNPDGARRAGHQWYFPEHGQGAENDLLGISTVLAGEVLDQFRRTAFGEDFYFAALIASK